MNVAGLSMVSNGIGQISGKVLLILVASILLKAHPGHASVNTWTLTFSVTLTDTSQTPNVFWGKLELTDGDVLPINKCGGWDVEVIFNEEVDIETTNDATYISTAINEDNETVHYFTNNAHDSVTNIDGVPTEILNFKGRTDDATSITATAMLIEKYHPPLDEVCTDGTTYTVTSARWSGGSEAGLSMLIQVPVDEDIVGGWELQVKFTEPLTLLNLANVNTEADDDNEVYTITNCCHWNSDIDAGSTIDLPITVKYSPDYCPQFCAELCDGPDTCVPGSEPTTSATTVWSRSRSTPGKPTITSGSTHGSTPGSIPESTRRTTSENTSGSTSDIISGTVPYFNRWQTIVIAVSPSSIAALILLCMLFALYCVAPRQDEDEHDSKVLQVEVVVDGTQQVHLDRYQQSSIEAPDDTNA